MNWLCRIRRGVPLLAFALMLTMASCVTDDQSTVHASNGPCAAISSIRTLPFKGESIADDSYNEIMRYGVSAVDCLIDSITDTSPMRDPRKTPQYLGYAVGDASLMVLADLLRVRLEVLLPEQVAAGFPLHGVDAYFDFVRDTRDGRAQIQSYVRHWWIQERERRRRSGAAGQTGDHYNRQVDVERCARELM